jgi:hypothetical protein
MVRASRRMVRASRRMVRASRLSGPRKVSETRTSGQRTVRYDDLSAATTFSIASLASPNSILVTGL